MADAEREARINLKTVADTTGANQTSQALDKVAVAQKGVEQSAKAAQKAVDDLAKKQAALRDAINGAASEFLHSRKEMEGIVKGAKATGDAFDGTQKATDHLTESKSKLRGLLKGLGFEFPQLSRLLSLIQHPATAAAAALGIAAQALLKWKAAVDEASQKQAALEAIDDEIASLERNLAEFERQAAASAAGFRAIGSAATFAAKEAKTLNDEVERARQLQDQLTDKGLALTNARIDAAVKSGKMTAVEGLEAKIAAEDAARERKAAGEIAAREAQLKFSQGALSATEKEIAGLPPDDPARLAALKTEADRQAALATASQADFNKFSAAQRDRIAGFAAERAALPGSSVARRFAGITERGRPATNAEVAAAIDEDEKQAQADLDTQRAMNEDRQRQADAARRALEDAQDAQRKSISRRGSLLEQRKTLAEQIAAGQSELGARRTFLHRAGEIDRATGQATLEGARGQATKEEAEKQRRLEREQDSKVNQALREELKRRGASDAIDRLIEVIRHHATIDAELNRKIEQLERHQRDSRGD